jgi:hypothetical protein
MFLSKIIIASVISVCVSAYDYVLVDVTKSGGLKISDCLMTPDLETRCDELGGNFYIQHCSQQWRQ